MWRRPLAELELLEAYTERQQVRSELVDRTAQLGGLTEETAAQRADVAAAEAKLAELKLAVRAAETTLSQPSQPSRRSRCDS